MLVSKFKVTAGILIAVGALTSGAGLFAYQDIGSGAAPRAVGSGSASGISPATPKVSGDRWTISAEELDAYAAQVEQLVRRARQEQAAGQWDGAARDLRKSVEVAGKWRDALMNGRRTEKRTTRVSLPVAPIPAGWRPCARRLRRFSRLCRASDRLHPRLVRLCRPSDRRHRQYVGSAAPVVRRDRRFVRLCRPSARRDRQLISR